VRRPLLIVLSASLLAACAGGEPGERLGTARQANVCATGSTLQGVDVSVYDGVVDWTQVAASGRAFAIAKATEGSSLTDAQFSTNWPAMKSAGVVRSAYHFFHCDTDPATQASFFLGVMGTLTPGDLPPSLDFEDTTTCSATTGVSLAIEWLDAVAHATGTLPILYTSVNVLSQFDDTQSFAGHAQLWVASRGVTCPNLPAPFTAWSFWQYSLTGTAPGLPNSNGMADLDEFDGDQTALLALTVGGSSASSSSSGSSTSGAPACAVNGVAGTCLDTSVCATMAGFLSTPGFCPGPASEQCCTPSGTGGSSSGAGGASTSSIDAGGGRGGAGGSAPSSGPTPGRSSGCAVALGAATTSTSALPAALLWVGALALSRRGAGRRRRHAARPPG
jgi:GH25 family lysozyme M1 (1,4-beta-N-acetylmuramidase)